LVAQLARRHVTVSLSGDGGDELFAGYERYRMGRSIWRGVRWLPGLARRSLASGLTAASPEAWNAGLRRWKRFLPAGLRRGSPGDRLHKLAAVLPASRPEDMYQTLISFWREDDALALGATAAPTVLTDPREWAAARDLTHRMMYLDTVSYLPDDILV